MTIIQQCETCSKVDNNNKNIYCNNCIKSEDYFDVYKYEGNNNNNNNRFGEGRLIGRIKAYTWHDAIEYIKNNLFSSDQRKNLNSNCEKDFAYIEKEKKEEKIPSTITTSENGSEPEKATILGYKIYLNNEGGAKHSESSLKGKEFWDLTTIAATTTSGITDANNNNNNNINSTTSNKEEYNTKQQQQ